MRQTVKSRESRGKEFTATQSAVKSRKSRAWGEHFVRAEGFSSRSFATPQSAARTGRTLRLGSPRAALPSTTLRVNSRINNTSPLRDPANPSGMPKPHDSCYRKSTRAIARSADFLGLKKGHSKRSAVRRARRAALAPVLRSALLLPVRRYVCQVNLPPRSIGTRAQMRLEPARRSAVLCSHFERPNKRGDRGSPKESDRPACSSRFLSIGHSTCLDGGSRCGWKLGQRTSDVGFVWHPRSPLLLAHSIHARTSVRIAVRT